MWTPLMVAETVFTSALVELSVAVAMPEPFVVAEGGVSMLPVVGEAANTTVAPETGLPLPSRAVTVIVVALEPLLAVIVPVLTVTVEFVGEIELALIMKLFDVALLGPVAVAVSS